MLKSKFLLFLIGLLAVCPALAGNIVLTASAQRSGGVDLSLSTSYAVHKVTDPTGELSFLTYSLFLFYPFAEQAYLEPEKSDARLGRTFNDWPKYRKFVKGLLFKMVASSSDSQLKAAAQKALESPLFKEGYIPKYREIETHLGPVVDSARVWIAKNKSLKVHAIHAQALKTYDGHLVPNAISKQRKKLVLVQK